MGPAGSTIVLAFGGAGVGPLGINLGFALALITRPRRRGLKRLLQGSSESSWSVANSALARTRFAGRSDFGTTPESNCTKGMYRPVGKQC